MSEQVLVRAALPLRGGQVEILLKQLVLVYGPISVRGHDDAEGSWLEVYQSHGPAEPEQGR